MKTAKKSPARKRKPAKKPRLTVEALRQMIIAEAHALQSQLDEQKRQNQVIRGEMHWASPDAVAEVANRVEKIRERLEGQVRALPGLERIQAFDNRLDGFLNMMTRVKAEVAAAHTTIQNLDKAVIPARLAAVLKDVASLNETVLAVAHRVEGIDRDTANWLESMEHRVYRLERPGPLRRLWRRAVNLISFEPERGTTLGPDPTVIGVRSKPEKPTCATDTAPDPPLSWTLSFEFRGDWWIYRAYGPRERGGRVVLLVEGGGPAEAVQKQLSLMMEKARAVGEPEKPRC